MLSKVMENASDLDQETQLQLYYASKLKEIIYNEYVQEDDAITSKFEFDI
jgi:hypothetical protein